MAQFLTIHIIVDTSALLSLVLDAFEVSLESFLYPCRSSYHLSEVKNPFPLLIKRKPVVRR